MWPDHTEWTAQAEHHVRTTCHAHQRVSADPDRWLTGDELAEARALTVAIVKATRIALTRVGRTATRRGLNAHGREAARLCADVDELRHAWGSILAMARRVGAAPEQVDRLTALAERMSTARDTAATKALEAAIRREVDRRNSDDGWRQELDRRARVVRGPTITTFWV